MEKTTFAVIKNQDHFTVEFRNGKYTKRVQYAVALTNREIELEAQCVVFEDTMDGRCSSLGLAKAIDIITAKKGGQVTGIAYEDGSGWKFNYQMNGGHKWSFINLKPAVTIIGCVMVMFMLTLTSCSDARSGSRLSRKAQMDSLLKSWQDDSLLRVNTINGTDTTWYHNGDVLMPAGSNRDTFVVVNAGTLNHEIKLNEHGNATNGRRAMIIRDCCVRIDQYADYIRSIKQRHKSDYTMTIKNDSIYIYTLDGTLVKTTLLTDDSEIGYALIHDNE